MTQTQMDLPTLITALCGHYTKTDGTPCTTLDDLKATPAYQTNYAAALKRASGDTTAATLKALLDMKVVREDVAELPVYVLHNADINHKGRGKSAEVETDTNGEPIVGVRVVLPDGKTRFLKTVPEAVAQSLSPGDAAKLRGNVSLTTDIVEGTSTYRISKDAALVAEAHDEPFPRMGFSWDIGEQAQANWQGAYYLLGGTVTGKFGKHWGSDNSYFGTVTLNGCAFVNEKEAGIFCEDGDGNSGLVMLPKSWLFENLNMPAADDRDAYGDAFRESPVEILVNCKGDVRRTVFASKLGDEDFIAAELQSLRNQKLLKKIGKKEVLSFDDAYVKQCVDAGQAPFVTISDRRICGIEVSDSGYTEFFEMPDKPTFTVECVEQELEKRAGGTWTKNEGLFAVPIGKVDEAPLRFSKEDPLYAALAGLEGNSAAPAAPEPTYNLMSGPE